MNHFFDKTGTAIPYRMMKTNGRSAWLCVAWLMLLLAVSFGNQAHAQTIPSSITVSGACLNGPYSLTLDQSNYNGTGRPDYKGTGDVTINSTPYTGVDFALYYETGGSGPAWVLAFSGQPYQSNPSAATLPPTSGWVAETSGVVGSCTGVSPLTVSYVTSSVTLAPATTTVCAGVPVSLTATPANLAAPVTYAYSSSPAGFSGSGTNAIFTQNAPSPNVTTTYIVTATATSGASSATATASVTVNPLPTVSITPSTTAICAGQSVTLSATPGLSSYKWNTTPTQTTASISVSATGMYSVTATNASGCSNTATASVTVNSLPTVSITPSTTAICAGQTVTLSATPGLSSYKWSTTPVQTTASISVSATGMYSVTATNASGCSATATASVTVNSLPTVSITPSTTAICAGQTVTLSATPGLSSYQWNTIPVQTTASISVSATGMYSVTATNSNGCSATATASVTVNSLPTVSITPSTTAICAGQTVILAATPGLSSYQWSTTPVQTTASISVSATGMYSVTATNANGCSNTATASVTVNSLPTVSITPSTTAICAGQTVTLAATPGLSSYKWNTTPTQTTASISVSATGMYSVTATNASNCSNTATASVTVNSLPTVSITPMTTTVCAGQSVTLSATPGLSSYKWSTTPAQTTASISVSAMGPYSVTVTDVNGCSNTATASVTVNPLPQAPTLVTQTGQSYPGSQSAVTVSQNTGNVILVVGGCPGGTITWSGGNATTLAVSTFNSGLQTFTAICTSNSTNCVSPVATATVNVVPTTFSVLHRDATGGQLNTNTLQPFLELQNNGNQPIPYSELTVRYYLTVENPAPLQFQINYAQLGSDKVHLRYVPLSPAQPGATGYIEFSFDASAGSLGAMSNSGPIQDIINKQDYSYFNQGDDYSYVNAGNFQPNSHITAYRNGNIIYGQEPGPVVPTQSVKAYLQNNTGTDANSIEAVLSVTNDGNLPINYSDLKVRYYFTADNNQPLVLNQIGYTALGSANVTGQIVTISPPLANADRYLEVSFSAGLGQLAPGTSTGNITYQIRHADYSGFNQSNDYSYQGTGGMMLNPHVVVFIGGQRAYGTEPGMGSRLSAENLPTELGVTVLSNPAHNNEVSVEVNGAQGQPLRYQLMDLNGHLVMDQQTGPAGTVERQTLKLGNQAAGLLLLRVSTPTQTKTVKVLKAD